MRCSASWPTRLPVCWSATFFVGTLPTEPPDMNAAITVSPAKTEAPALKPPVQAPLLRVESVSKTFGAATVLHPVNLQLGRAEVVAIVGRSGSGKSTLLRLI